MRWQTASIEVPPLSSINHPIDIIDLADAHLNAMVCAYWLCWTKVSKASASKNWTGISPTSKGSREPIDILVSSRWNEPMMPSTWKIVTQLSKVDGPRKRAAFYEWLDVRMPNYRMEFLTGLTARLLCEAALYAAWQFRDGGCDA